MNAHDLQRKMKLIKTLQKAMEHAETAKLYLTANDRDLEEIWTANDVIEHIDIALKRLGTNT